MDYHVFILSRIKELVDGGMPTDEAVARGIKSTAGMVTSAALVMVGVFLIFVTLSIVDFKEFGIGLASAILIDATIIRGVLLPATMKLLGDWNWYLPAPLQWLPRFHTRSRSRGVGATERDGAARQPAGRSVVQEGEDGAHAAVILRGGRRGRASRRCW